MRMSSTCPDPNHDGHGDFSHVPVSLWQDAMKKKTVMLCTSKTAKHQLGILKNKRIMDISGSSTTGNEIFSLFFWCLRFFDEPKRQKGK